MTVWVVYICEPYEGREIDKIFSSEETAVKYVTAKGFIEDRSHIYRHPKAGQDWLDGERIMASEWLDWKDDDERWVRLENYSNDFVVIKEMEVMEEFM